MGEHICFRRNERLATVNPYWRGNPMVRGRFFNRQHRFRPGMGSVLKWRLSPNPQRKEKKTYKRQNKLFHFHKTFCSEFDIINTKQNVHFTKVVSPIFQFCLSLHQFSIGAKVPFINKRD